FDLLHDAYVADDVVRSFLLRENPAAAATIAARLDAARRRGLWHPRRNDVDASLRMLAKEAAPGAPPPAAAFAPVSRNPWRLETVCSCGSRRRAQRCLARRSRPCARPRAAPATGSSRSPHAEAFKFGG